MPTVVMTKDGIKSINALDSSVSPLVNRFIEKLAENDELDGLRVKPLKKAADRRVRTARVNDNYRAVLFRVDSAGERIYHVVGVWPHDEGNDKALQVAASSTLTFNTTLGVAEVHSPSQEELDRAFERGRAEGLTSAALAAAEADAGTDADQDVESETVATSSAKPERDNPLENENWTVEMLVADAGITQRYAEAAMAADDQAGVSQVAERMPEVQRLVLLELAMGTSLAEARANLDLPDEQTMEELRAADPEQQLVEGTRNAPSAFSFLGDTPEAVRRAYSDLSMEQWQIFLHPEQKRYVDYKGKGSFRLTGGAGTGKTVILVHRARALHQRNPQARILLTTFTVTLAAALREQLSLLDRDVPQVEVGEPGVCVNGIDQLATAVMSSATAEEKQAAQEEVFGPGRNEFQKRVMGTQESKYWQEAVASASTEALSEELKQPTFLMQEYLSVVLARRITNSREYARVPRPGRGTRLSRPQRSQLWSVFEQFRNANLAEDRLTFAEVTVLAAAVLEKRAADGGGWLFDHVLIDEAQDFHAGHWQLLRALAPTQPDDLFIAEDAHQRIYGQKLTLKRFGIEIRGRSRRLKLNYRTTAQNLEFAMRLLEGQSADGEEWQSLEGNADNPAEVTNIHGYTSVLTGPAPKVVRASGAQEEYEAAAEQILTWIQERSTNDGGHDSPMRAPHEIAVLTRSIKQMDAVNQALATLGVPVQTVERNRSPKAGHVQLRTMHGAKGMEFKCVVLVGVGEQHIPAQWALRRLPDAEKRDARQRERSLLYVAASRAREELLITYSGPPSDLLPS